MYYIRTTGGGMMAVTPKSKTVVAVKKDPAVVKVLPKTSKKSLKKG